MGSPISSTNANLLLEEMENKVIDGLDNVPDKPYMVALPYMCAYQ